jgi:integrase
MKLYNANVTSLIKKKNPNIDISDLKSIERLEHIRDVFCFACFTGQRFGDIKKLKRSDIFGNVWHLRVEKTKDILEIPLTKYALEILKRYSQEEKVLPVISHQKSNVYIKELCKLVGIEDIIKTNRYMGAERIESSNFKHELIGMHIARKTFVTISLEKGMRPELVMEITGHKDFKTMKKYIKITSQVKKTEMDRVWSVEFNTPVLSETRKQRKKRK